MTRSFCELVGCRLPLQQAGMGTVATPALAAAVADAGALGMIALHTTPANRVAEVLDALATRTTGAVGVNFLMPFLAVDAVEAAASRCRVVEFFYGDPARGLVERVHQGGALACWQVGSVAEAESAVDVGCDLIVAQGVEAGGHVRGTGDLRPLLEAVLGRVDRPVVAAGGIATAQAVADVLEMGAAAARVGTRFVTALESDAHPDYVDALLRARPGDTVLTDAFSIGWPDAPHRVLASCVEAAAGHGAGPVAVVGDDDGPAIPVHSAAVPQREMRGDVGAMALYAGVGVGSITVREPVVDIVRDLTRLVC